MQYCLAWAYACRALVPELSHVGAAPSLGGLAAFHATSALWYACRWSAVARTDLKGVTWVERSEGARSLVAGAPLSRAETALAVTSAALQYPVYNPAAAAAPFLLHTALGLPTTSNVLLAVEVMAFCAALLFESSLLLPLCATGAAFYGYGTVGARATPRAFGYGVLAHLALGTASGALFLVRGGGDGDRLALLSASASAVLCAEARVRAAASLGDARRQVVWACRTATLCSVATLAFRACAWTATPGNHIATAGLGVLAACAPWHWQLDAAWRRRTTVPWRPSCTNIPPRAVAVATAAALASLCAQFVVLHD